MTKSHAEIAGIPLGAFDDPIRQGLEAFRRRSGGDVTFEVGDGGLLEPAPDKSYSAHGIGRIYHLGHEVSTLSLVAFAPGDGTGDPGSLAQNQDLHGPYPHDDAVIPRDRQGVHTEVSLALASFVAGDPESVRINAGNLDLIGLSIVSPHYKTLFRIATIGQYVDDFQRTMHNKDHMDPIMGPQPRYTVGRIHTHPTSDEPKLYFGRRHAVYNPHPRFVQVFGFFAINNKAPKAGLAAIEDMVTEYPFFDENDAQFTLE